MRTLLISFSLLFFLLSKGQFNADSLKKTIFEFRKELNEQYRDSVHSPLSKEDRLKFKEHQFFDPYQKYCVVADFVRTPEEKPFEMKTSTDRRPLYVKYGEIHFTLNGKKHKLSVYQNMSLLNDPKYRDYLFLPFKDLTSGKETYGGGRFIDLTIPAGKRMIVDFNKAYNPYCAYSHAYSCPVPPPENFLDTEVKAGIKAPKD